ncbi:hypothetical protein ACIQ2D_07855 [Lysinibacillus sp. NPDC097287]|uniref:hypothetical protein n=1 Tax=Lysinibacillus sp. NPDC097287 TaxID=3364144 RepID=UPI0037F861A4
MFNYQFKYRDIYLILWIFCQWLAASSILQHPSFEKYMYHSLRDFENPSGGMLGFAPAFVVIYSVLIAVFIFIVIFILEFFFLTTSFSSTFKDYVWLSLFVGLMVTLVISIRHMIDLYFWGFFLAMLPYLVWFIYGALTLKYFRKIINTKKTAPD